MALARNRFNQKQLESTRINKIPYIIASDYEPEGREFESLRAHHIFQRLPKPRAPGLYLRVVDFVDEKSSEIHNFDAQPESYDHNQGARNKGWEFSFHICPSGACFGTRRSKVQILSPRPFVSITYLDHLVFHPHHC